MKKLRVYLDTSVINFLFADDAPEKRDTTVEFFERFVARGRYETCISPVVLAEISRTPDAGKRNKLLEKVKAYSLREVPLEVMGDE